MKTWIEGPEEPFKPFIIGVRIESKQDADNLASALEYSPVPVIQDLAATIRGQIHG